MTDRVEPKQTMIRYLVGEMPEPERASFEDEYLDDTGLFHQLVELESDLIDLYSLGILSDSERRQLEQHFLLDPERSKRLAFAKSLGGYSDPEAGSKSGEAAKPSPGIRPWFRVTPQFAAASVCLAMLAAICWLALMNQGLRREMRASQAREANTFQDARALRQRLDSLTKELGEGNGQGNQIAGLTFTDQSLVTFTLRDVSRGNGEAPKLEIPAATNFVVLRLLFPFDSHSAYRLTLETANGRTVWHEEKAKSQLAREGNQEMAVVLPTTILPDGDYVLRVSAGSGQHIEDVAGYSFHAAHR